MPPPSTGPSTHLTDVSVSHGPIAVHHAVVAWFCDDRGFGQLRLARPLSGPRSGDSLPPESSPDGDGLVYVDQRDILCEGFRALKAGQHVTFVPGRDAHGLVARQVAIIQIAKGAIAS